MDTIKWFFGCLNSAWDKEPETLIELGITDEVFMNIENYVKNLKSKTNDNRKNENRDDSIIS